MLEGTLIVRDEVETGWPNSIKLHQRISAFVRHDRAYRFKVGITTNLFLRTRQHQRFYNEMIVVYQTSSDKFVRRLEKFLTDYFKDRSDNERAGGGGRSADGPYYLYVLVRWKANTL